MFYDSDLWDLANNLRDAASMIAVLLYYLINIPIEVRSELCISEQTRIQCFQSNIAAELCSITPRAKSKIPQVSMPMEITDLRDKIYTKKYILEFM